MTGDNPPKYRLLTRADKIQAGDQVLADDVATWTELRPGDLFIGCDYRPEVFLPVRRPVSTG